MSAPIRKDDPRYSLRGVRRHGAGWQVYRMVGGEMQRKVLPLETSAGDLLKAWESLKRAVVVPVEGSLAAAIADYLPRIAAKATAQGIATHLALWCQALGPGRAPASIEPGDIDRVIQRWLVTPTVLKPGQRGRPSVSPHGLAGDTIRRRCTSLQSFLKVTLPAGVIDPVRACTARPPAAKATQRGVSMGNVVRILAAMPDYHRNRRRIRSLAKLRAAVVAFTGLDPAQIMTIAPDDLRLTGDAPAVRAGRRKGRGVEARWLKLTEPGRRALQAFADADAFGRYNTSTVNRAVRVAAAKVGIPLGTFRVKDLRHSFGSEMYRVTKDLAAVGRFLLHAEGSRETARYTLGAHDEVDAAAAARFTVPEAPTALKIVATMPARYARKR
jgi:integrase